MIFPTWRRRVVWLVRLVSFLLLVVLLTSASIKTVPEITPEEYAIYSRLIQHFNLSGQHLVMIARTSVDDEKQLPDNSALLHLKGEFPALYIKTITDFRSKNARSWELDRKLSAATSYALVSQQELDKFWANCKVQQSCGWDLFYGKYPSSSGIITVSRVGFSSNGEYALAYLGNRRHWKSGTGYLVLLRKNGSEWNVVKSSVVWMS